MKSKKMRQGILLILAMLFIATNVGSGGESAVRSGSAVYSDMHYRNPWHQHHHHLPPPGYLGPPPVILPPDIPDMPPVEAVPLPM